VGDGAGRFGDAGVACPGGGQVAGVGVVLDWMERVRRSLGCLACPGRCGGLRQGIFNTEEERGPRRATEKVFGASRGVFLTGVFVTGVFVTGRVCGASCGAVLAAGGRGASAESGRWFGGGPAAGLENSVVAARLRGPQWPSCCLRAGKRAIGAARRRSFASPRRPLAPSLGYAGMPGASVAGGMDELCGNQPHGWGVVRP
jgi:hypothetical protein